MVHFLHFSRSFSQDKLFFRPEFPFNDMIDFNDLFLATTLILLDLKVVYKTLTPSSGPILHPACGSHSRNVQVWLHLEGKVTE